MIESRVVVECDWNIEGGRACGVKMMLDAPPDETALSILTASGWRVAPPPSRPYRAEDPPRRWPLFLHCPIHYRTKGPK